MSQPTSPAPTGGSGKTLRGFPHTLAQKSFSLRAVLKKTASKVAEKIDIKLEIGWKELAVAAKFAYWAMGVLNPASLQEPISGMVHAPPALDPRASFASVVHQTPAALPLWVNPASMPPVGSGFMGISREPVPAVF